MVRDAVSPALYWFLAEDSSLTEVTSVSPSLVMMSPCFRPAASAQEPDSTELTYTPAGQPKVLWYCSVMLATVMPMEGRPVT